MPDLSCTNARESSPTDAAGPTGNRKVQSSGPMAWLAIPLPIRSSSPSRFRYHCPDGEPDSTCGDALRGHWADGRCLTSNPWSRISGPGLKTPPDSAGNGRADPAETPLRTALSSGCSQSRCADQAAPRPVMCCDQHVCLREATTPALRYGKPRCNVSAGNHEGPPPRGQPAIRRRGRRLGCRRSSVPRSRWTSHRGPVSYRVPEREEAQHA
jgi:hypothetical protein